MEEHEVFFNTKMIMNTSILFFSNSCLLYSFIGVGKELVLWATFFFPFSHLWEERKVGRERPELGGFL